MRLAERRSLKESNYDLFDCDVELNTENDTGRTASLPTEEDLAGLFRDFNCRFFGGELPVAQVEWSTRMKHAGKCIRSDRIIRLGVSYHMHFPEDVADTLKHEMIHLVIPNHGSEFKREANRIGTSRYARHYPGMLRGMKYMYDCPACNLSYPSRKMLRNRSCGPCSKGKYDSRFKLKFVKRLDDR